MDCQEYREAIAADPQFDGGAGHVAGCAACRDYRSEMLALDAKIASALAIEVPPLELPELPAVGAGKVVALGRQRRMAMAARFAVAASVVLAVLVGVRMLGTGIEHDSLADEVLAHIDHEPYSMRVTDVRVTDERLTAVVAGDVAAFEADKALITYAQTCVINGRKVPHLVIQGERGPVMILLMPEEKVAGAIDLEDENSRGVILPVGDGSIAIVGSRDERLDEIRKTVIDSVTWST